MSCSRSVTTSPRRGRCPISGAVGEEASDSGRTSGLWWSGLDRKLDGERRPATRRAVDGQRSSMLADDAVRDAQTEAGAVPLRRDERVEDRGDGVGRNALARVLDLDAQPIRAGAVHGERQAAL